jgi:ATP-dependent DNA helicase RecG
MAGADTMTESETREFKKISNHGCLYGGLTLAVIRGGHVSRRRNPLICEMFRRIHMVEAWGRGLPLILQNEPDVQFKETAGIFIVSFKRPGAKGTYPEGSLKSSGKSSLNSAALRPAGNEKSREKGKEKSTEKILNLMAADPAITTKKIAGAIGLSTAGIEKAVRVLKQQGKLRRIGPDKGGRWEVLHLAPDATRRGAGHGG